MNSMWEKHSRTILLWSHKEPQKWLCNLWTLLKTWFIISKSELIRIQRAKKSCHPIVLCSLKSMILMILWPLIEQCGLLCYELYRLSVSPGYTYAHAYAMWYPEYSYQTMVPLCPLWMLGAALAELRLYSLSWVVPNYPLSMASVSTRCPNGSLKPLNGDPSSSARSY